MPTLTQQLRVMASEQISWLTILINKRCVLFSSLKSRNQIVVVETVVICHCAAVNVEPPVTDEILLVVESSNWAKSGEAWALVAMGATVVNLAVSLWISIISWAQVPAGEVAVWDLLEVGIIPASLAWN